jgi:hypothetical protein
MRPVSVFANAPPDQIEQVCARLRGPWRQALRAVMVLLSVHGLIPTEIAELLECHPGTVRRWIDRFNTDGPPGLGCDRLKWPHPDGLKWPRLSAESAPV